MKISQEEFRSAPGKYLKEAKDGQQVFILDATGATRGVIGTNGKRLFAKTEAVRFETDERAETDFSAGNNPWLD